MLEIFIIRAQRPCNRNPLLEVYLEAHFIKLMLQSFTIGSLSFCKVIVIIRVIITVIIIVLIIAIGNFTPYLIEAENFNRCLFP